MKSKIKPTSIQLKILDQEISRNLIYRKVCIISYAYSFIPFWGIEESYEMTAPYGRWNAFCLIMLCVGVQFFDCSLELLR